MSSDVLRRAAARLREAAASATPGPWKVDGDLQAVKAANGITIAYDDECEMEDGRYLALMHPPVALALADWLDVEAANMHGAVEAWSRDTGYIDKHLGGVKQHTENMFAASLALARAILREDS